MRKTLSVIDRLQRQLDSVCRHVEKCVNMLIFLYTYRICIFYACPMSFAYERCIVFYLLVCIDWFYYVICIYIYILLHHDFDFCCCVVHINV